MAVVLSPYSLKCINQFSIFWEIVVQNWDEEVWDIPNVKSNHPEKTVHPCQYPIELVERCILALTDENDLVFDPYAGVGSSIIAALKHNRRGMGCEQQEKYVEVATERLNSYFNGTLKMRPLGKPVHQPTGREKVSQRPQEWQKAEPLKLFENSNKYKTRSSVVFIRLIMAYRFLIVNFHSKNKKFMMLFNL